MAFLKKETTENCVFMLTVPLRYTRKAERDMKRMFDAGLMMQHHLMSRKLKALRNLERTRAWKQVQTDIAALYQAGEDARSPKLKAMFATRNALLQNAGLDAGSFVKDMKKHAKVYKGVVHSQTAQNLAANVWKPFEEYLYGKGKEIRFKSWKDFTAMYGKSNITGIRYKDGYLVVGKKHIQLAFDKRDKYGYEHEAMKRKIHYCGIVRKWYPDGWRYFAQLCLGGKPPIKVVKETGAVLHPLGRGDVGNDIGPQTLATVGDNDAQLVVLADKVEDIHKEIRRIQRKMNRSRREHNPLFFNDDGTVVPINKLPKECLTYCGKRKWNNTNNYLRLESRLRALYRLIAVQREQAQNELANKLLAFGNKHYIEEMNWRALAKRTKADRVNDKGKHLSKKRFGKSIANKAPGKFVEIYRKKVEAAGGEFHEINTTKCKASQYNHMDHAYKKKKLYQRWNYMPNGDKIQRDLYSAFLIQNTNRKRDGFTQSKLQRKYDHFKEMHDLEIARLSMIQTPSSAGVKRAG